AGRGARLEGAHLGLVASRDCPSVEAVWSALDGGSWNGDHVMLGVYQHLHVDELAGPQLFISVGKQSLETDCGRRLIDDGVDQQDFSGSEQAHVVLIIGRHLYRTTRHGLAHIIEKRFRQGEDHRRWLRLGEHDKGRRVRSVHDIANIDLAEADATIY